jgi:hypothetical protein
VIVKVREECENPVRSGPLYIQYPQVPWPVERYERMIEREFMKGLFTQGGVERGAGKGTCPLISCPQDL